MFPKYQNLCIPQSFLVQHVFWSTEVTQVMHEQREYIKSCISKPFFLLMHCWLQCRVCACSKVLISFYGRFHIFTMQDISS